MIDWNWVLGFFIAFGVLVFIYCVATSVVKKNE